MRNAICIVLLLCSAMVLSETRPKDWAVPIKNASLDNFYQVAEGIYRSAQPTALDFQQLQALGIGEVLNLREYHSDDDEAEGTHIRLHRIKVDTGDMDEAQLYQALQIMVKRQSPLLVHCWHGSDRTGAVIAAYRVVVQGWSKQAALDELKNGGFGYHARIYPNIVRLIESLDVAAMRQRLGLASATVINGFGG